MRAGSLDKVITIANATDTLDAYGVPATTYTTTYTLRAELLEAKTEELIRDHGASTEQRLRFRTWWRSGITVANRLSYGGAAFNIVGIEEIGRNRELILTVERIGP